MMKESVVHTICRAERTRIKSHLLNLKNNSISKMPIKWSHQQEMCLARVLLGASMEEGKPDITALFNQANNDNAKNGSCPFRRRQVRDKVRTMKTRYYAIKSILNNSNIPEEEFRYRTPHEAGLFKIWKKIWDKGSNNNNTNVFSAAQEIPNNISCPNPNPNVFSAAQEIPNNISCPSPNPNSNPNSNSNPNCNGYDEDERITVLGNEQLKLEGLVDGLMKRTDVVAGHLHSVKGLLAAANGGKKSEKNFRDHVVRKLKLYAQGLELLREECTLGFENLGNLGL